MCSYSLATQHSVGAHRLRPLHRVRREGNADRGTQDGHGRNVWAERKAKSLQSSDAALRD
jgi:hypothetical protein